MLPHCLTHLTSSRHIEASHKEPGEEPDDQGQTDHSNSKSSDDNHQVILGKVGEVEHAGAVSHGDAGVGSHVHHGNFIFDVIISSIHVKWFLQEIRIHKTTKLGRLKTDYIPRTEGNKILFIPLKSSSKETHNIMEIF